MTKDAVHRGTIVAGALGECVHVAGIQRFLQLAESSGWKTIFLGPAVSASKLVEAAAREKADIVGVSYRLSPENAAQRLAEFAEAADDLHAAGIRFAFGGTQPVAEIATSIGFFEQVFDGTQTDSDVLAYLRDGEISKKSPASYPETLLERIAWKAPYPVLRHHFGLPNLEATIDGVRKIADAGVLDVISLGIDQDAQANFFHPERQDPKTKGAGGVPVRSRADYEAIYDASRTGNFPLMRTYSGTDDFIRLAELYVSAINIAWCAIPIFWFNRMDGRGPWDLEGSITEHQKVMRWYGERDLPVEVNDPHHWGMRDAPDVIYVAAAYLSAYNARAFGVRDYVAQMMFNSPAGMSDSMDLAKILACLQMIGKLEGPDFRIWRQTRTGLLSYPVDLTAARAHLAASVYLQMAVKPHVVHIVGHTEAHHAATAEDVVEAVQLATRSIQNAVRGAPDMTADPAIIRRTAELIPQVETLLEAIRSLASSSTGDPLTDPAVLARAVEKGLLDAPHLQGSKSALGAIKTTIDARGACVAIDPLTGQSISEEKRIALLDL